MSLRKDQCVSPINVFLEAHSLSLDLRFETSRQYYLRLPISDLENGSLPDVFINIFKKKNYVEFQTLELVKLNQKVTDSHNEVVNVSYRSVQELIDDIRSEISGLFRVSESIAMLDMLAGFARLAATQEYVKPELTDTLAIKGGRHPIRERIQSLKYVPNDAYAAQQSRFQIITGCNMSGKSTYIRSLALITVMAQIGCYVPAQYASIRLIHQLFARVSTDDSVEANISSFSGEMREMAFIMHNLEPNSMLIIDELGRGTSTVDGLAIAIAIAEALIDSHAFVWFVTHFRDLAQIMAERNGVVNLHLAVKMSVTTSKMTMLYKLEDGYMQDKHYGIALAKLLPLPRPLLETAEKVSEELCQKIENQKQSTKVLVIAKRRKLILDLREQLFQIREGSISGERLRSYLKNLEDEFISHISATYEESDSTHDYDETTEYFSDGSSTPCPSLTPHRFNDISMSDVSSITSPRSGAGADVAFTSNDSFALSETSYDFL